MNLLTHHICSRLCELTAIATGGRLQRAALQSNHIGYSCCRVIRIQMKLFWIWKKYEFLKTLKNRLAKSNIGEQNSARGNNNNTTLTKKWSILPDRTERVKQRRCLLPHWCQKIQNCNYQACFHFLCTPPVILWNSRYTVKYQSK